ncbi:MAG: hypothetical protein ABR991_02170 [Terracidiphilus sp.]
MSRFGLLPLLGMTVVFFTTGCPQSQDQVAANSAQTGAQDQSSDPASANLAPADTNAATPANYAAPTTYAAQPSAPLDSSGSYDQASGQGSDDPGYGVQPVEYADQPPPPLPDYDQPPAPSDGYLWTPGYWGWGQGGYYWVPGGWVEAPYQGALWTPGYWGYHNHRYGFYRGYWGPHIGYYGGVDYGFGYVGIGYQGGYWGGGHFNYNRSYNNVNVSVVHNVYSHGGGGNRGGVRVSFNGGSGGLQVRARPAELAARHEQHAPPMRAQLQNEHVASTNKAQFASVNHGRPASLAVSQPLVADRNIHAPAAVQARNQSEAQQRNAAQAHPIATQPAHANEPVRNQNQPIQNQMNRPQASPQQQRQTAPQQQQQHQSPQLQQQHQATPPQQQRQAAPIQPQHQAPPTQPQHQAAPQQQQRQAAPQQQQRQAAPQQQRQAAPQQHQAPPPQQRQAPPPQQHQSPPQQHQAAQQHQAPPQHPAEEHPKK